MKRRIEIRQWERQLDEPNLEGKSASAAHRAFRKVIEIDDADPEAPSCAFCGAVPMHLPVGAVAYLVLRDLATGEETIHYGRGVRTPGPLALLMPGGNYCLRLSLAEAVEIFEGRQSDGWEKFIVDLTREAENGIARSAKSIEALLKRHLGRKGR